MLLLALLLQSAVAAAPAASDDDKTVVVVAPSETLRTALDRCIAGGCTPRQDIAASIRYAEVQFRAGRYLDSRHTLQDAIARDRRAAGEEPVAVAALYEATATVALHDGEQDVARHVSGERLGVLRAAFGENDPRYLQALLDDIDIQGSLTRRADVQPRYAALEKRARAAGQPAIAATAAMRRAAWQHVLGDDLGATRRLQALAAAPDQGATTRLATQALLARFGTDRGDTRALDRLPESAAADAAGAESTGAGAAAEPMLLWQPPIPSAPDAGGRDPNDLVDRVQRSGSVASPRWADIGFLVMPNGRVSPPEILKSGGGTGWAKPIMRAIGERRYLPTGASADRRYRVERWTLTADYFTPTGSFIRIRGYRPHYVQLDMTTNRPVRIDTVKRSSAAAPPPASTGS